MSSKIRTQVFVSWNDTQSHNPTVRTRELNVVAEFVFDTFPRHIGTDAVARVQLGLQEALELGNLDAKRDWGYAAEYVEGMWRMLQAEAPDTFVLATGHTVTVRDFVQLAFKSVGIDIEFEGQGESEAGIDAKTGKTVVRVNPTFYRPAEVELLVGDASKAEQIPRGAFIRNPNEAAENCNHGRDCGKNGTTEK